MSRTTEAGPAAEAAVVVGDAPVLPVEMPPVGATAPVFRLSDEHGSAFDLAEQFAEGPVLVVFYPFAFSGTCTGELTGLLDLDEQLGGLGVGVVAVSCDPLFAQRAFSESTGLTFPLLSDFWPHGAVTSAYGVFDTERGCPKRASFLIGPDGRIRWSVLQEVAERRDMAAHLTAAVTLFGHDAADPAPGPGRPRRAGV